jgi:hypothetical protein
MDDLGCIGGQGLIPFPVFIRNQPKYGGQLRQGFFPCRHERMASGYRRNFRHPSFGLVPIEHYLIVVEAHRFTIVLRAESLKHPFYAIDRVLPSYRSWTTGLSFRYRCRSEEPGIGRRSGPEVGLGPSIP